MKQIQFQFSLFPMVLCVLLLLPLALLPADCRAEPRQASVEPTGLSAQSYCLMDSRDHSVLTQKNKDLSLPMASTTKIMTALVILEHCDLNALVSVSPEAAGTEGSSVYLQTGEKITVRDLLYALMLESANDAAMALALHCCDTVELFSEKMNQLADRLGMENSKFLNPSGLSQDGHCSSAEDLALLASYAMKNPVFREITATKSIRIPMENAADYRYLSNHNRLLNKYEHCIGGKTGYTIAAGRCLVSVSQKDGVELVAVTLNAPDDWNDHVRLFDYGFSLYQAFTLCEKEALRYTVPVVGGKASGVEVTNRQGLSLPLRDQEGIEICWELPFFLYAPVVAVGEEGPNMELPLGRAVFSQNGVVLGEVWLYAAQSVEAFTPPTWWERVLQFFGWKE